MVLCLTSPPPPSPQVCDGVLIGLLRADLLHLSDFDVFLSKAGDAGRNVAGLAFTMRVVNRAVIVERLVEPKQLTNTLDFLVRVTSRPSPGPQGQVLPLLQLLQGVKDIAAANEKRAALAAQAPSAASAGSSNLLPLAPPTGKPLVIVGAWANASPQGVASAAAAAAAIASADAYSGEYRKQVLSLLEMWVRIQNEQPADDRPFSQYLSILQETGCLANDAQTEKFFRVLMDLCVESCAVTAKAFPEDKSVLVSVLAAPNTNALAAPVPTPRCRLTYTGVDALSRLVLLLLLRIAEGKVSKMNLLQKLMGIFARVLLRDADVNGGGCSHELAAGGTPAADSKFDARPYLRLLTNLFRELPLAPANVGVNGITDETAVSETSAFNAQVSHCPPHVVTFLAHKVLTPLPPPPPPPLPPGQCNFRQRAAPCPTSARARLCLCMARARLTPTLPPGSPLSPRAAWMASCTPPGHRPPAVYVPLPPPRRAQRGPASPQ